VLGEFVWLMDPRYERRSMKSNDWSLSCSSP